ncbi:Rrf2 family transcriptional regulator [Nonomuraea dietziae]|uniref:Rrf2 family transcriptional regulator n=1 Tax=Nonomuraea dietziae TaxID=65515 RepID=UPI003CD07BD3
MRPSARVDYALRAAAEHSPHAGAGPTTVASWRKEQDMPPKYLENILLQMRRAGLVLRAARAAEGGYVLARPAAEISLWRRDPRGHGPTGHVERASRARRAYRPAESHTDSRSMDRPARTERAILEEVTLDQVAHRRRPSLSQSGVRSHRRRPRRLGLTARPPEKRPATPRAPRRLGAGHGSAPRPLPLDQQARPGRARPTPPRTRRCC